MATQIFAPWSDDDIAALWRHQRNDHVHPYTCGNDHTGSRELVPTRDGWQCPICDYQQNWAWKP